MSRPYRGSVTLPDQVADGCAVTRHVGSAHRRVRIGGLATAAHLLAWGVVVLSCTQALPETAQVRRVIDGDTIEIADGRPVRYIGIDTPEVRRRTSPDDHWVKDPEPLAQEATAANQQLVGGKTVRLEYDVQTHDRHGRLLAYVFVGEDMVNGVLLEAGYATPLTIPPNVKYAEPFRRLEAMARTEGRGLWAKPEAAEAED